ncbi:hypothetical protein HN587_01085 [Candidatus Woesearchaeota archaeon]|jgi:hypothetical protein|nr:hypothetical protein [Candidatus Woesearchaeota archaeon]
MAIHHKHGHYAFIAGILLAIIAALFQTTSSWVVLVLVALGLIVGFLNVNAKETTAFLIAVIALIAAGSANLIVLNTIFDPLGTTLSSMLTFIKVFVAPAAIVVALKSVKELAEK